MTEAEDQTFRHRLREEPTMDNVLAEIEAHAGARGEARGKISILRHLVAKGRLTVAAARTELDDWVASGELPADLAKEGRDQLG